MGPAKGGGRSDDGLRRSGAGRGAPVGQRRLRQGAYRLFARGVIRWARLSLSLRRDRRGLALLNCANQCRLMEGERYAGTLARAGHAGFAPASFAALTVAKLSARFRPMRKQLFAIALAAA